MRPPTVSNALMSRAEQEFDVFVLEREAFVITDAAPNGGGPTTLSVIFYMFKKTARDSLHSFLAIDCYLYALSCVRVLAGGPNELRSGLDHEAPADMLCGHQVQEARPWHCGSRTLTH